MKQKENLILIILTLTGIIGGYIYWRTVGCISGTCPIFSRWYLTMIYGGFMGYLIGDIIKGYMLKRKKDE